MAYFFLRSGLETELLEAESKSEVMQRKVDLLDKEKKALSKEYEAHLVKCEESLQKVSQYPFHRCCIRTHNSKLIFNPQLKAETAKWKSEAEAFEDKAIALETKLSARDRKITDLEKIMEAIEKNQVVAAAEASAATEDTTLISQRADELQESLDRLQEDFRLQKIEVRIAERKATEERERVVTLRGMLKEEREKIKKIEGRKRH